MSSWALVTGATAGIGESFSRLLASHNYNIVLIARDLARLEERAKNLEEKYGIQTQVIQADLATDEGCMKIEKYIAENHIDVLINNAGNAHGLDPIQTGNLDDWDAMIDINLKGLLYVSRAIIPNMVARESGHIINIGSTAAKEVYPNGNVYCATKHAVDSLNQAMRIDLNPYGIRVGAIHPGMVDTEFSTVRFKGDKEKAANVYKGFSPLQAEDLADIIHFVVTRPYHVNIADLVVMPTAQAMVSIVKRNL